MKTILWKELRENLKWAALALVGLSIAEIFTLFGLRNDFNGIPGDATLCNPTFLMVTAFGCSLVGAALGALQILPERRRDQWASLVHRPIPRRAIFLGKLVAGLILYLFAAIPPLLASIAFVATPGQFATPFVPGTILPAASDLLLGMTCYNAALLVALHHGRWYGRGGLLVLGLLPVAMFHLATKWMFLTPLVAAVILGAAASGAMASNGPIRDYPFLARWSFVLVLFLGVEVVAGVILFAAEAMISRHERPSLFYRDLALTRDGKILVTTERLDDFTMSTAELDGTPVTDERYIGNNRAAAFCEFLPVCRDFQHDQAEDEEMLRNEPRDERNYLALANRDNADSPESWYLLVGKNEFVGYDKLSRRRIGFLDHGGFHTGQRPRQPFPGHLHDISWNYLPYLYWSKDQLYALRFSERSARPIFAAPNDTIIGVVEVRPEQSTVLFLAVALEKRMEILDPQGAPLFSIPYGRDPSIWGHISLATLPAGGRVFVKYQALLPKQIAAAGGRDYVDEIDLHGHTVHTDSLVTKPLSAGASSGDWLAKTASFTLPLAPAVVGYAAEALQSGPQDEAANSSPWEGISHAVLLAWFGELAALCAVLASGAYFWGRRAGLPANICRRWALFVFCFGLPGLVTFRLAAGWPAKVRCLNCGRQRSVEREECPGCQHPWPAPKRSGVEIFDLTAHEPS